MKSSTSVLLGRLFIFTRVSSSKTGGSIKLVSNSSACQPLLLSVANHLILRMS